VGFLLTAEGAKDAKARAYKTVSLISIAGSQPDR
jgi:hypothetical protein